MELRKLDETGRDDDHSSDPQVGPDCERIESQPLSEEIVDEVFDFDHHRQRALDEYVLVKPVYDRYAETLRAILVSAIGEADLSIHSVEARGKALDSFARKATSPSESFPDQPKYSEPLSDITDLAAARVITFFLDDVERVDEIVRREFSILERSDKGAVLETEAQLGYRSIHYLVRLNHLRSGLPEYAEWSEFTAELQVRTILQHAWAEIEHDIQYKALDTLPNSIRRRFVALAGVIEIADREFQAIDKANREVAEAARTSVHEDRLEDVEITPDSLKSYLDKRLGPDGRMSEWSYAFTARLLGRLGFKDLDSIDDALTGLDPDRISRSLYGTKQGQLYRFEDSLLVAMGERYIDRHLWNSEEWWPDHARNKLDRIRGLGIEVGHFDPESS